MLLIDIGNTRTKYVVVEKSDSQVLFSSTTLINNEQLTKAFCQQNFEQSDIIALASVRDSAFVNIIKQWASQSHKTFVQIESEAEVLGIKSCYQQPETLGVDRWLAMLGTAKTYPQQNVLIVDAGTAITLDLLSNEGQHLGGWIVPGINTMFTGLLSTTDKVHAQLGNVTSLCFGDNTSSCVNHGVWALAVGVIEQAVKQAEQLLVLDKVIIIGGDSLALKDLLTIKAEFNPNLLFSGLYAVARAKLAMLPNSSLNE